MKRLVGIMICISMAGLSLLAGCATYKHNDFLNMKTSIEVEGAEIRDVLAILKWNTHCQAAHRRGGCDKAHLDEPLIVFTEAHKDSLPQKEIPTESDNPFDTMGSTSPVRKGSITMRLTNAPVMEIISSSCKKSGYEFYTKDKMIVVGKNFTPPCISIKGSGQQIAKTLDKTSILMEVCYANIVDIVSYLESTTADFMADKTKASIPFRLQAEDIPSITIKASYGISVMEVISILTEIAPLSCTIDESGVTFKNLTTSIEGRIMDMSGKPVSDVEVTLYSGVKRLLTKGVARTNSDGAYKLQLPKSKWGWESLCLDLYHPSYADASGRARHFFGISSGDEYVAYKDFTMLPAGALSGRVVDQNGDAVTNANLMILGLTSSLSMREEYFRDEGIDSNGQFMAVGLFPRKYDVVIYGEQLKPSSHIGSVEVQPSVTNEVRLVVPSELFIEP